MADNKTPGFISRLLLEADPGSLGGPVDFDVKGLGRRLPRTEAPEGWTTRIERRRQGRVWVGYFHVWTTDEDGRRVRRKKEKTLGPASMPKHEAQSKLAGYIEEYQLCRLRTGPFVQLHDRVFSVVRLHQLELAVWPAAKPVSIRANAKVVETV